jgi:hypothetical protein
MDMRKIGTATIATVFWLILALAIDKWLLRPYCAACVKVLALHLRIKLPAAELTYPPVSVLALLILPMIILALYLLPWRRLGEGSAWRESLLRWCQPWFWLLIAIVLTVAGESIFIVVKDYLPTALMAVVVQFAVTVTLTVFQSYKPLSLTASLFGLLGLVIGMILFISRGVKEIFN